MTFLSLVDDCKLVTGDAAMGSQLIAHGLATDVPGELWNIDNAEVIQRIQRQYVEAGAQYLITNTFAGNPISLARHDLKARTEEINEAAVNNARKAGDADTVIIGDIGPSGQLIEPFGTLTKDEAQSAFETQARALERAGVDALLAETFESISELRLALNAARNATDLPIMASMKFNAQDDGEYRSVMGDAPADLVQLAENAELSVIGSNCGQTIKTMVGLVKHLTDLTDLPIIAQPNAGKPRLEGEKTVYDEDAETFAEHVPSLYEAGANIIGGCCGTTPAHVEAIRSFADSL
ncbi:MAG: homocysteine S-methyltransferase family protein [Planctomycetota bacterium]